MNFSIIHPSRSRPDMAITTAMKWINNMGAAHQFEYILSLDNDDPDLEKYEKLFRKHMLGRRLTILTGENKNVVQAMNAGAKASHFGEVLICTSDDMDPPFEWGSMMFHNIDPDLPEALQVNHLNPDIKEETDILCLPILTRKLYDILQYVYYPEYSGIYADDDLARLCLSQGWLRKNFKLIFPHIHWSIDSKVKKDQTHMRHDNPQGWTLGKKVLEKRKRTGFGLPEPEKLLSILIPTIDGRETAVRRLMGALVEQLRKDGYMSLVDLQYDQDNKEVSIGKKRDRMYKAALGKYSWQIDDDDWFNPKIFRKAFPELLKHPDTDCVGFQEECSFDNKGKKQLACHSNIFSHWDSNVNGYDHVRTIFYKDIIRTEIAQTIGLADLRYGEDSEFSKRLKASGLLKKEFFINEIMYYYHCNTKIPHNLKYGIK